MKRPELLVFIVLIVLAVIVFFNENESFIIHSANSSIVGEGELLYTNPVNITIISPDCDCYDAQGFVSDLKSVGLNVSKINLLTASEGYGLIEKYGLEKLPAILFSDNVVDYYFFEGLAFFGTLENDGVFVFRSPDPPFYSVVSGEVVSGGVTVTYINHSACSKCYDVTIHRDVLEQSYDLNIVSEVFVNETSFLIEKYNITKLPTIVLSSEASDYSALMRVWYSAGLVASDGSLVFTDMSSLGKVWYYDLELDEIV